MALKEFHLPDIGEGIAEGEIVRWLVKPGQQVKEEQEFVEVMTDKATVMITVPHDGVIKELRVKEGDVVPVESVIAVIDVGATAGGGGGGGGDAPKAEAKPAAKPAEAKPAEPKPAEAKQPAKAEPAAQPAPDAKPVKIPTPEPAHAAAPQGFVQSSPGKVLAAPATRRRARELGIDLAAIPGTGPRGRITNDDLAGSAGNARPAAAAASTAAPAAKAPAAAPRAPIAIESVHGGAREERIPFRGLRRKIADAMTRSKQTAAHFTYVDDIDVTQLVALRTEAKAAYAEKGVNITYLPFVMKACVEAMKQFPMMNCALDESTQELVVKRYFNFGIATDTENGLVVPVVKDVDRKSIAELARDIQELAQRTRDGKIAIDDLKGGTFTLTNAGNIGGLFATPVINFPEVAILGIHAIKKTPVVRDGEIVIGDVMYLSVSIDHRIVDGATGARWMNVVKSLLENPQRLLLGSL
jgi:pyruvate dehydrogenase E2 component (dihydrolipoamide acetyltransferase)